MRLVLTLLLGLWVLPVHAEVLCMNCGPVQSTEQPQVQPIPRGIAPRRHIVTGQIPQMCRTSAPYCLEANSSTRKLTLYENGQGVIAWDIIMLPPGRVLRGQIEDVILNPTWCPTASVRRRNPGLPAGCLPPGHRQNAMGEVKITLNGDFAGTAIRIHDTRGFGASWPNEDSAGCVRVLNLKAELLPRIGNGRSGTVEVVFF